MSAEPSTGVDLARVALAAAKQAAKERGANPSTQRAPKRRSATRGSGRDPVGLGGALARLIAERGWESPAAGGTVMDQWEAIATPQIAEKLQAVAFDKNTGQLDLLPVSNAWATQARLISAQLIQQCNERVGTETVRRIRVLPPGAHAAGADEEPPVPAPAPQPRGESRTKETAGYHRALEALATAPAPKQATRPPRTPEDGCDAYRRARALVKNPPSPRADPGPVRTRADGCDGYHQALAQMDTLAPAPARERVDGPHHATDTPSPGYELTRRALLENRTGGRPAPPAPV
ncbi:DciA family protein [Streptomyces sp. NPDC101062]|uniref:DciA family protein n=1 Tax=unclassified Streptomyces TaxID=2593676 RepID=UPI00381A6F2B